MNVFDCLRCVLRGHLLSYEGNKHNMFRSKQTVKNIKARFIFEHGCANSNINKSRTFWCVAGFVVCLFSVAVFLLLKTQKKASGVMMLSCRLECRRKSNEEGAKQ